METVGAAAQHHGVAAFQAQRAGVGGDVRPALVDDADHAERRRDPLDLQAVGPLESREHPADRIGQSGDLLDGASYRLDAGIVRASAGRRRRPPCREPSPRRGRGRWRRGCRARARAMRAAAVSARVFCSPGHWRRCGRRRGRCAPISRIAARTSVSAVRTADMGGSRCENGTPITRSPGPRDMGYAWRSRREPRHAHKPRLSVRPRRHAGRQRLRACARLEAGARRGGHRAFGLAHPPQDRHERRVVHQPALCARPASSSTRRGSPASAPPTPKPIAAWRPTIRPLPGARELLAYLTAAGDALGDRHQRPDGDGGRQPQGARRRSRENPWS